MAFADSPRPLAIVLLWAASAAACPDGWSASPAGKCYKVTSESASHLGCVDLCGRASLACIRSAEENAFAVELVGKDKAVWIGNYQAPGSVEPDGGWGQCSTGEASGYVNWAQGQPGDSVQSNENCAFVKTGLWHNAQCAMRFHCLCERGANASSAYLAFVEAYIPAYIQRFRNEAALFFGVRIPLYWALPALLLLWQSRSRLRVAQLGWMLLVVAVAPVYIQVFGGMDITPFIGTIFHYAVALPWGLALMLLAILPHDD